MVGKFGFKRNQPSTNLLAILRCVAKLGECEIINRNVANVQQVCKNFNFKNNQEIYIRSTSFFNELKKIQ